MTQYDPQTGMNNRLRPVLKQEGYSEANNSVKQSLITAEDSSGNDID